jgi:tripartite-type tricarboxylate transporter receptor subunit TctC
MAVAIGEPQAGLPRRAADHRAGIGKAGARAHPRLRLDRGRTRISVAPDIPTVDEAGLPGFHRLAWVGLWMPKGASSEVIGKVNNAVQTVLAEPSLRARVSQLGQEVFPREQQTPDGLAAFQRSEIEKWWPIIKAAGIKAE